LLDLPDRGHVLRFVELLGRANRKHSGKEANGNKDRDRPGPNPVESRLRMPRKDSVECTRRCRYD